MNFHPAQRVFSEADYLPIPMGLPTLLKLAFDGCDLAGAWNRLVQRINDAPEDAAALMDLSTIALLQGRRPDRLALQSEALKLNRIYRQLPAATATKPIRVLAFVAAGDFLANLPVEFLLECSSVQLDMVYVSPGVPIPEIVPDHDLALVAVAESDENQTVLRELADVLASWPRPVLNAPERIARLTREGTWELLRSAPGVVIPMNARVSRAHFARIGAGQAAIADVLDGSTFPIIARPIASHAGDGLIKLDELGAIVDYLKERSEDNFYVAPFVDYRGRDGLFRKYRIVLIDGKPYASHMAISSTWMIHYLNAGMMENAEKRNEEARFMGNFDRDFAVRHNVAFRAIADGVGLDYIPFDCGETKDGKLLIFKSGTNMIVHAMNSSDLFPYKRPQMEKLFGAFERMLENTVAGAGRSDARCA